MLMEVWEKAFTISTPWSTEEAIHTLLVLTKSRHTPVFPLMEEYGKLYEQLRFWNLWNKLVIRLGSYRKWKFIARWFQRHRRSRYNSNLNNLWRWTGWHASRQNSMKCLPDQEGNLVHSRRILWCSSIQRLTLPHWYVTVCPLIDSSEQQNRTSNEGVRLTWLSYFVKSSYHLALWPEGWVS